MNNINSTKTISFINNCLVLITIPGTIFGVVARRFVKPTGLGVCMYMCAFVCVSLHMSMFLYMYVCVGYNVSVCVHICMCVFVCVCLYRYVFVYVNYV